MSWSGSKLTVRRRTFAASAGSALTSACQPREAPVEGGTEVGQGAAGEDEGDRDRVAAPLGEMPGLPVLVDEGGVGDRVVRRERPGSATGIGSVDRRREPVFVSRSSQALVSVTTSVPWTRSPGDPALEERRVLHRERHGHGRHEARDVLVADHDLEARGVHREDLALELVTLALGPPRAGGAAESAPGWPRPANPPRPVQGTSHRPVEYYDEAARRSTAPPRGPRRALWYAHPG